MIHSTQKLNGPIVQITCQVPCLVKACPNLLAEGVPNEFLRSQLRAIQITPRQSHPTNTNFSWHTNRNGLQIGIEQIYLRVRDRTTKRELPTMRSRICNHFQRTKASTFRWTVKII